MTKTLVTRFYELFCFSFNDSACRILGTGAPGDQEVHLSSLACAEPEEVDRGAV